MWVKGEEPIETLAAGRYRLGGRLLLAEEGSLYAGKGEVGADVFGEM